jgi:hypothetical protein
MLTFSKSFNLFKNEEYIFIIFLNINIIKHKTELANIGGILKLEDLFLSLLIKYRKARKLKYKEYKKKLFNQLDLSRDSDPKNPLI